MREHGDALDFDLFDRWRVRLDDVPLSIGWGAVALYLRHIPYDSELMREVCPQAEWSRAEYLLAQLIDMVGDLFAEGYEHIQRPYEPRPFSTAEAVDADGYAALLERFRRKSEEV